MSTKILTIVLTIAALVLSISAQEEKSPIAYKGRFDFDNPSERVLAHRFFDNNTRLWMLGGSTIQVWDVETNKVVSSEKHGIPYLTETTLGALSPDGTMLFVKTGSAENDEYKAAFKRGENPKVPEDLLTYRNGALLLSKPAVWNLTTLKRVKMFDMELNRAEWSRDGRTLMTSNFGPFFIYASVKNAEFQIYDVSADDVNLRSRIAVDHLTFWHLHPDGRRLYAASSADKKRVVGLPVSTGNGSVVDIWNTASGQVEDRLSIDGDEYVLQTFKLSPSPSGRYLAMIAKHKTKDAEHKVVFWELNGSTTTPKYTMKANPRIRDSMVAYSPDEEFFALDVGKNVQLYYTADGKFKSELKDSDLPRLWMDNNRIVLDKYSKRMGVIETTGGNKVYDLPLVYRTTQVSNGNYTTDVNGVTTSGTDTVVTDQTEVRPNPADQQTFLTYSNKYVKIFDVRQGTLLATPVEPSFTVTKKLRWSSDDEMVEKAGWSDDGQLVYAIEKDSRAIRVWSFARK